LIKTNRTSLKSVCINKKCHCSPGLGPLRFFSPPHFSIADLGSAPSLSISPPRSRPPRLKVTEAHRHPFLPSPQSLCTVHRSRVPKRRRPRRICADAPPSFPSSVSSTFVLSLPNWLGPNDRIPPLSHRTSPGSPLGTPSPPARHLGELPRLTPCRAPAPRLPRACAAGLAPPRAPTNRGRTCHCAGFGHGDRAPSRPRARTVGHHHDWARPLDGPPRRDGRLPQQAAAPNRPSASSRIRPSTVRVSFKNLF
jgi:hypothetical protein